MELAERFKAIKAHYSGLPLLQFPADQWSTDPYEWDRPHTGISLSPIEWALWQEIRAEDAVFYPQYPVLRYFVDFANPAARVAIECDGARWHTDTARDAERQRRIEAEGWTVYRISGRDCLDVGVSWRDANDRLVALPGTARQFVRLIARTHRLHVGARG